MLVTEDDEPAFPHVAEGGDLSGLHPSFDSGMSLRDYFAAAALTGILTDSTGITKEIATGAYQIADAMLKARKP